MRGLLDQLKPSLAIKAALCIIKGCAK